MRYSNAAEGLKLMFYGEIVTIVAGVLRWIPLIGPLIGVAGSALALYGLYRAKADDKGYETALYATIGKIVADLLMSIFQEGFLNSLLAIVSAVFSLGAIYFVCITTSNLLHSRGNEELSQRGITVWKINLICTAVVVVLLVLMLIPIINILAALGIAVVAIASVVGYVLYMIFLYRSSQAL